MSRLKFGEVDSLAPEVSGWPESGAGSLSLPKMALFLYFTNEKPNPELYPELPQSHKLVTKLNCTP